MKKDFCSRLRELRGDRSQTVVASLLGMPQQSWQRYEGGVSEPNYETLHRICCILGASADWLFGLTDDRRGLPAGVARDADDAKRLAACPGCAAKAEVIADQARSLVALSETVRAMSGMSGKNGSKESSRLSLNIPV